MFKRCDSNGCFWNDNMIKIPYGIGVDKTKKQNKKRLGYIMDWIEYNHDFLSGTKSKIHHYNDSFYKKLFQVDVMQVLINIFLSTLITTISLHISWIPFIIVTKN